MINVITNVECIFFLHGYTIIDVKSTLFTLVIVITDKNFHFFFVISVRISGEANLNIQQKASIDTR